MSEKTKSSSLTGRSKTSLDQDNNIQFGCMMLQQKPMSILLVFGQEDRQSDGFCWAAKKLGYSCTIARTAENALETFLGNHQDVVIVDARTNNSTFDALSLCRSIKASRSSEFTVLLAVTNRSSTDQEEPSVLPLLKAGFSRRYQENSSTSACINELQTLDAGEVRTNMKLHASATLFTALDQVNDAVEVTDSEHHIQYVNHVYEKMSGYSSEELIGRDATDLLYKSDKNREIVESIKGHMKKGKHWEGTHYTRRKSGNVVPFHSKVTPLEGPNGSVSHYVTVKHSSTDSSNQLANGSMMSFPRRRESVVRAASMTIEAPITKVINIINAAQENSPLTVSQALDKVLEILQTTELYSPFQHQELEDNDPMASDLVEGLMSQNVKRKLSGHDMQKGSLHTHSHGPSSPASSLSQIPENIMSVLDLDASWEFDIFALERMTNQRPLLHLGLKLFSRFGLPEFLNVHETTIVNWLNLIESNYHSSNHYHNSTHAADVLHATAYFLERDRTRDIFDQQDITCCLIAAAAHDVDHPARTNAFLINEKHQLAILYNDHAVLENHHASMCFKLTHRDEAANIFKNLSSEDYKQVRQSIIDQILATDMKQHFEHLSKFTSLMSKHFQKHDTDVTPELSENEESSIAQELSLHDNKILIKRMMIKCADISNPLRPLSLCKEWGYRIAEEYCQQTDEERRRGLPVVMAQFDRKILNIPKCQLTFINIFITSMFDAWDVYCNIPVLIKHLTSNYEFWKGKEQTEKEKELKSIHDSDNS